MNRIFESKRWIIIKIQAILKSEVRMSGRRGANARRRLFNDAATDENCEQLNNINGDEENEQFLDRKQEEWNFDFRNGRPLPGRYAWQPVESSSRRERGNFTTVTSRVSNNESFRSAVHTTTTRQATRRVTDTQRHSPYNLRSRPRTHTNERGFLPIVGYTHRDRSSSRSSNTSTERLEGDVRT